MKGGEGRQLADRLSKTNYYRDYFKIMSNGHIGFTLSFYDMRGNFENQTLPSLFVEWVKRKSGILRKNEMDDSFSFKILSKFLYKEKFHALEVEPSTQTVITFFFFYHAKFY